MKLSLQQAIFGGRGSLDVVHVFWVSSCRSYYHTLFQSSIWRGCRVWKRWQVLDVESIVLEPLHYMWVPRSFSVPFCHFLLCFKHPICSSLRWQCSDLVDEVNCQEYCFYHCGECRQFSSEGSCMAWKLWYVSSMTSWLVDSLIVSTCTLGGFGPIWLHYKCGQPHTLVRGSWKSAQCRFYSSLNSIARSEFFLSSLSHREVTS